MLTPEEALRQSVERQRIQRERAKAALDQTPAGDGAEPRERDAGAQAGTPPASEGEQAP